MTSVNTRTLNIVILQKVILLTEYYFRNELWEWPKGQIKFFGHNHLGVDTFSVKPFLHWTNFELYKKIKLVDSIDRRETFRETAVEKLFSKKRKKKRKEIVEIHRRRNRRNHWEIQQFPSVSPRPSLPFFSPPSSNYWISERSTRQFSQCK